MAKGKSKKSKNSPSIDLSQYPEGTTEINNPNFYFGYDGFHLQNGDCYVGGFCAHKIGIVWREGNGIYITKDNHSYEGVWENDQLLNSEDTFIKYPTGEEYHGQIEKGKYKGVGTYTLANKLQIDAKFEENVPVGEAILTDPQNNIWKGQVSEDSIIFRPENQFYVSLPYDRGIGKNLSSDERVNENKSLYSRQSCKENIDRILFKKSSKTLNDFKDTLYDPKKPHSSEEFVKPIKKKSIMLKARSGSNLSLLRTFFSKDYKDSFVPLSVFYPTVDTEQKKAKEEETNENKMN